MSPKSRPPKTVLELVVVRGGGGIKGLRKARKVLLFGLAWSQVEASIERQPTIDEYAEWWRMGLSSAYREWALWKDLLPEWATPSELFDALGVARSVRSQTALAGLPVPA